MLFIRTTQSHYNKFHWSICRSNLDSVSFGQPLRTYSWFWDDTIYIYIYILSSSVSDVCGVSHQGHPPSILFISLSLTFSGTQACSILLPLQVVLLAIHNVVKCTRAHCPHLWRSQLSSLLLKIEKTKISEQLKISIDNWWTQGLGSFYCTLLSTARCLLKPGDVSELAYRSVSNLFVSHVQVEVISQ